MKSSPHSLHRIFSPSSVAVVGASRRRDSIGYCIVDNLLLGNFSGVIYPVNPNAEAVHSFKCYPSLQAIPDDVDLVIISVPRDLVESAIDDAVEKKVAGIVVITAGFSETGEEGTALEQRILEKVRAAGIRMIGPNCMGIINTDSDICLNATFAPTQARRGSVGFVSQSGALGVAILNVAESLGLGLTQFVSMGNKADVSGNDLIEYWEESEATKVVAMYLESLGNPRKFTEMAKRVGRKKPILIVKSGRTEEGARAASSHTGALAGADITVSAFLNQCGVVRANTIEEMFDLARALEHCPLASGNRVAIVTNAGGPAIMATDACVNLGLEIPTLSEATQSALAEFLPTEASFTNPVDMIASAREAEYQKAMEVVMADPQVDMALAIYVTPMLAKPIEVLESISRGASVASNKPLLTVIMAAEDFYDEIKVRPDLPPVYRFPESAARALSVVYGYSAWRQRPHDELSPEYEVDDDTVARLLAEQKSGYLEPEAAFQVLESYGIPIAGLQRCADWDSLRQGAESIGYPVVLKAISPELIHKSDVGGVRLGISNEAELEAAYREMETQLQSVGHPPSGYLVQKSISGGQELVFGLSHDPRFGPLIMFGRGGKYVEVVEDVCFGVTPLSPSEADDMIQGIRSYRLLEGYRGEPGVDQDKLREILLRIAQLATRHPSILELDVNPLVAGGDADSLWALDVRIRVG